MMETVTAQSLKRGENTIKTSERGTLPAPRSITRGLAFERSWPYLFGLTVTVVYCLIAWRIPVAPGFRDVLTTTAGLAGNLAGFLAATAGILTTVSGSEFMQQAKQAGVYENLVQYLLTSMGWCIAIAVLSILSLYFDWSHIGSSRHIIVLCWVALGSTALAMIIRVMLAFSRLMKYIAKSQS